MQLEIEKSSQVAPMSDLCRQWQQKGEVGMDWYFELAEKFGAEKLIFNSVQISSPLFERLREKTQQHKMAPVYVVTAEQFCEITNLQEHLQQGVHYTVLIYAPMSTEMACRVEDLKDFLPQMSFVILARKDWNVQNCYRSIPHFMRHRLFVDFPVSIHESDPFYEPAELTSTRQKFAKDFLDHDLQSFCPNLGIYNEWGRKNISHFSQPRKLLRTKPKVSIIAQDPEALNSLMANRVLQKSPEDFEILITRVAGQKTKVIPKVPAVVTTRYWAHPIDADRPVSGKVIANFTASQADGDYLVFLDPMANENLDSLFSVLLSGEAQLGKLLLRKNLFVFAKKDFFQVGGFDDLLATWSADRVRLLDVLYPDLTKAEQDKNLGGVLEKIENSSDQLLLAHRFADQIEDFGFLGGQAPSNRQLVEKKQHSEEARYRREQMKDKYRTIYQATPKVALEGQLNFLIQPFVHAYRTHGWKFSPLRLRHFYRTHYWKYNIFHYVYHYWRLHAWKVSPLRLRHYMRPYTWRLNPWTYSWPWKLRGAVTGNLWRITMLPSVLYGWGVRAYWAMYRVFWRLSYPMRKIYYFSHFQYEKRILGLHTKPEPMRES